MAAHPDDRGSPRAPTAFTLALPEWAAELARATESVGPGSAERMRFAIELARQNVERGSGGPFGAFVVERDSGRLLALGVNRVVASSLALAHAEVVALALADEFQHQRAPDAPRVPLQLVSSVEPCMMCLGALMWSGVASLVFGALDADARAIGFDEGCKPADWPRELARRGIDVQAGVERDAARAVLASYAARGGAIYNRGAR